MRKHGWRTNCSGQARTRRPLMSKSPLTREFSACNCSLKAARALTPLVSALLIAGCQTLWWGQSDGDIPVAESGTLASLTSRNTQPATKLKELGATPDQLPANRVSLESVMRGYQDLLPLVDDPTKQITIRHRLADLEFARAERILADSAEDDLSGAIAAYTSLLADYPERDGNDQIYYQLARAYELRGMTSEQLAVLDTLVSRYPRSAYWEEAQFRRGDTLFINGRYSEAEQAFAEVTRASSARNSDSSFEMNAHYMKGWSQFKQGEYQQALYSYIAVLDLIMPVERAVEMPDQPIKPLLKICSGFLVFQCLILMVLKPFNPYFAKQAAHLTKHWCTIATPPCSLSVSDTATRLRFLMLLLKNVRKAGGRHVTLCAQSTPSS